MDNYRVVTLSALIVLIANGILTIWWALRPTKEMLTPDEAARLLDDLERCRSRHPELLSARTKLERIAGRHAT